MSSVLRVFIIALLAAGAAAGAAVAAPRPQSLPPGGAPVAALAGTFRSAQDAPFPYVFATGTERLSVAGVNAAMEQQIGVLAAQASPVAVKVWGARYGASRPANQAELIVSEILIDSSQALPTAAPTPAVTAIVRYNLINLYATPYQSTAVVGQASGGQVCPVLGRDTAATWLYLDCNGVRGWADARLVSLSGSLSSAPIMTNPAPTPTPRATVAPTPSPTPPPVQGWRASYFANANLDGAPVLVADAPSINFDWGYGSPGAAVPVDYFSARYERTLNLASGLLPLPRRGRRRHSRLARRRVGDRRVARRHRDAIHLQPVSGRDAAAACGVSGAGGRGAGAACLRVFGATPAVDRRVLPGRAQ
jgi:hypothetical protein